MVCESVELVVWCGVSGVRVVVCECVEFSVTQGIISLVLESFLTATPTGGKNYNNSCSKLYVNDKQSFVYKCTYVCMYKIMCTWVE